MFTLICNNCGEKTNIDLINGWFCKEGKVDLYVSGYDGELLIICENCEAEINEDNGRKFEGNEVVDKGGVK